MNRCALLCFSKFSDAQECLNTFLDQLLYYQTLVFHVKNNDVEFFQCIIHMLYLLVSDVTYSDVRAKCLSLWKLLVLQKPGFLSDVFRDQRHFHRPQYNKQTLV